MRISQQIEHWPAQPDGRPDFEGIRIFLKETIQHLELEGQKWSAMFVDRQDELLQIRRHIATMGIQKFSEDENKLTLAAVDVATTLATGRDDLITQLYQQTDFYKLKPMLEKLRWSELLYSVVQFVFGFAQFHDALSSLKSVENACRKFRSDIIEKN